MRIWTRQFPTFEEAIRYLESKGTLEFFGRVGTNAEKCLYRFTLHDGRKYLLNVHITGEEIGKIEVTE